MQLSGVIRCALSFVVAISTAAALGSDSIIIPAIEDKSGSPAILAILQGAQIPAAYYVPLAKEIQKKTDFPLHVILPDFSLDLVLPVLTDIEKAVNDLKQKINGSDKMDVYLAGHSIGAIGVMNVAKNDAKNYQGILLFGASLLRSFKSEYPLPIMIINPELDGLQPISRATENFFNQFDRKKIAITSTSVAKHPVIVIEGMNHFQFAEGSPPPRVKNLDLKSEITNLDAREQVASLVSNFLCLNSKNDCKKATAASELISRVTETRKLIDPMIEAYRMEASPLLFDRCDSDTPSAHCPWYAAWPPQEKPRVQRPASDCICGAGISNIAATIMANLNSTQYPLINVDALHSAAETKPSHFAHLWTNCTTEAKAVLPCLVNSTTVTEPVYKSLGDFSFGPSTAYEVRIKMKSRQAYALYTFDSKATLDAYDSPSICAEINQKSYEWALSKVTPRVLQRFKEFGVAMVMTKDESPIVPIGPGFINKALAYTEVQKDGQWVLEVTSVGFKTPEEGNVLTGLFPNSNGFQNLIRLPLLQGFISGESDGTYKRRWITQVYGISYTETSALRNLNKVLLTNFLCSVPSLHICDCFFTVQLA